MVRVYLAGPIFTPQDRGVMESVEAAAHALGHETYVPHRRLPVGAAPSNPGREPFAELLKGLESCDAVVAVLDGRDVDPGTCVELGYALAQGRAILGLRSDARRGDERDGINLMAFGACHEVVAVPTWSPDVLRPILQPFLSRARVFAGTLVRDAVPKLLEAEGRALRFRPVNPEEYPSVLKRKVVETARRLEASDFGVEQEEIADLLELLETLINLRRYDTESLRSIKEGKWRKRGGYERGFLLDEEPPVSSR